MTKIGMNHSWTKGNFLIVQGESPIICAVKCLMAGLQELMSYSAKPAKERRYRYSSGSDN